MRRVLYLGLVILLLAGALRLDARPAMAQPPDSELGDAGLFVTLFPELRTLPPPLFLRLGTRASYQASSAIIGGGPAGAGIVQYDAVAFDGVEIVVSVHTFLDNGGGALVPTADSARIGLPAVGDIGSIPRC